MHGMVRAWKGALLLAVVASPWLVGLAHPFLYDDVGMIAENPFLEEPANLGRVLAGQTLADPQVVNGRRPAVLATYFIDRAWHGLQPTGWRATNLVLHAGGMLLLMGLLRRLGAGDFLLLASGVLFALHPAPAEAVHAPGFRADLLCLLCMLAALHGFLSVRNRPAAGLALGGVFTALALLSKETALALPLLLGALMVLFPAAFPRTGRGRAATLAVCTAVAAGFFGLWLGLPADMQALGGSWNGESLRFPKTLFSVPALWMRTLRMLWVPWPLNVTPHFDPVASAGSGRFWGGAAVLAGCVLAAWRLRRTSPWASLGLAWMLVFFLPVSNVLPLLHPVADRYLYPLAPGFAVLVAWGISRLPGTPRRWALAGLGALYALLIVVRLGEWESAERLWTSAYARNPLSATAATWLGLLSEEAGDAAGAREWYARAAAANPREVSAWINWGILAGREGQWAESESLLRRAVEVRPESARAWHNLSVCLERQGRIPEAAGAADRAEALRGRQGSSKP
jgi:protein O-mannosyl-transferase